MKNLIPYKIFENFNQKNPQIGDYVLCEEEDLGDGNSALIDVKNFVKNNIGKLIKIVDEKRYNYFVQYENIPENIIDFFYFRENKSSRIYYRKEIKFFSPNKKDAEIILQANKYNL